MGNFLGWLARMSDALATPDPNTGQSPLDSIRGALAVVGAAAHNPAGLEALQEQRQSQQAAKDYNLRQQQVQNQLILARQNAVREQAVADAQVKHLNAQTDQITNPQEKPGEIWKMSDAVDPATGNLLMYEEHSGQTKVTNFKPKAPTNPSEQPLGADRVSQLNSALQQRFNVLNPGKPLPAAYQLAPNASEGDYSRIAAALGGAESAAGTQAQRAFTQQQAEQNRQDKLNKPTADEQRRADLAENLNENLNALEDIVNRRPELFGAVNGRVTQLRGFLGSDDSDVAALQTIQHQLGMAQISAHGMRSSHGIEGASNSILNSFKNGPDAVKSSIKAARNSVQTFTNDLANKGGAAPSGGTKTADPLNIR